MALQGIEVEGVIIKVYEAKEGVSSRTGNAWKSQEYVIQTKDQYPRICVFRVFGADKIEQFRINQGDSVRVWLDINARPWQDRYFNDISAFRVDHIDPNSMGTPQMAAPASNMQAAQPQQPQQPWQSAAPSTNATPTQQFVPETGDDLPF